MDPPCINNWRFVKKMDSGEARKRIAWANTADALVPGYKIDCDNQLIRWDEYGQNTAFGWHIDHALPLALGGGSAPANLRARHWRSNCSAGGLLGSFLKV